MITDRHKNKTIFKSDVIALHVGKSYSTELDKNLQKIKEKKRERGNIDVSLRTKALNEHGHRGLRVEQKGRAESHDSS